MAVYLRKKKLSGGRQSFYLDIWHDEERYYEFLKLYTDKARTPEQKESNREIIALAESIRAKKEIELQGLDHDYIPKFKQKVDFLSFYEDYLTKYKNKDIRLVRASLNHFKALLIEKGITRLPAKSVNEELCKDYKDYLENHLNGETIFNYFQKFKAVIRKAAKEKIINFDITAEVTVKRTTGLKKDILNYEEIVRLAAAKCGNEEVKKAFLFSLNTGLRFCDIKDLKWSDIDRDKMTITQKKVQHTSGSAILTIDLNKTSMRMVGERGKPDQKIFSLPSQTACLKDLKVWVKNAGIEKHITWHCSRHSFAVNLLDKEVVGADVKTVAALLGHSNLDQVNVYLRVIDERKKSAVNSLPDLPI